MRSGQEQPNFNLSSESGWAVVTLAKHALLTDQETRPGSADHLFTGVQVTVDLDAPGIRLICPSRETLRQAGFGVDILLNAPNDVGVAQRSRKRRQIKKTQKLFV